MQTACMAIGSVSTNFFTIDLSVPLTLSTKSSVGGKELLLYGLFREAYISQSNFDVKFEP